MPELSILERRRQRRTEAGGNRSAAVLPAHVGEPPPELDVALVQTAKRVKGSVGLPPLSDSPSQLVTQSEAFALLRISVRTGQRLRSMGRFPKPDAQLSGPRWLMTTVQRFIAAGCDMQRFEELQTGGVA